MSTPSPVYVLDTNVFVQAHRRHYAFEICPGFWDCLIHHHETRRIVSIDRVREEILAGDALEAWVKASAPPTLFAPTADATVTRNYADMVRWVQREVQFRSEAKTEFAQVGGLLALEKLTRVVAHCPGTRFPNNAGTGPPFDVGELSVAAVSLTLFAVTEPAF